MDYMHIESKNRLPAMSAVSASAQPDIVIVTSVRARGAGPHVTGANLWIRSDNNTGITLSSGGSGLGYITLDQGGGRVGTIQANGATPRNSGPVTTLTATSVVILSPLPGAPGAGAAGAYVSAVTPNATPNLSVFQITSVAGDTATYNYLELN